MEQIKIENLSFSYPLEEKKAIDGLSLSINEGEFVLLCGKSGCGKTTLLRQLKNELAPHGKKSGLILFEGRDIKALSLRESAEKIGFVMQNPQTQIVTDKVWHEISFGLENLGLKNSEIRLRTAEMACYFGISEWFHSKTNELSGGQKQILNLASVMVMHPDVLILDEPTSQLDPIAAEKFLQTLEKINRELGTTIILTEQRLQEAFSYADRILVMDKGKLVFDGTPKSVGENLKALPPFLQKAAPSAMRIYSETGRKGNCPVNVRQARDFLRKTKHKNSIEQPMASDENNIAVELKDICFRYEKNSKDVLNSLSLKIFENEFTAILGANAAGKTTLLKIIAGTLSAYEGKIKVFGHKVGKRKIIMMPQDVQTLFTSKSVFSDLKQVQSDDEKIKQTVALTKIEDILDKSPFDLSGGEQQRAALAKVLLCEPEILLLDEPTKGMDALFKAELAKIIESLKKNGKTIVIISHDIEFCAEYADRCAMLFDGEISAFGPTKQFFDSNRFYTTSAGRIARGIIEHAVTEEDILKCITEN